jgi:hypothetical protein
MTLGRDHLRDALTKYAPRQERTTPMGLTLKEGTAFKLVPAGQYNAVCVDVVDLGIVKTTWQGNEREVHKCRIVFELDAVDRESGKRLTIGAYHTASLGEKANLRKFLEAWRGRPFTAEELKGFDTEVLIGVGALIQVVHATKGDKTYDNINSIMVPPRSMKWLEPSGAYTRVQDRPKDASGAPPADDEPPPHGDDDLPF